MTIKWSTAECMERSNKVDHNMIEDMMNNGHGHREQASISHRRAQKAAIHSGIVIAWSKVRQDTVTDPLYSIRRIVVLTIVWHWRNRKKLAVERLMWVLSLNHCFCSEMLYWCQNMQTWEMWTGLFVCVHSQSLIVFSLYVCKQIFQQITAIKVGV